MRPQKRKRARSSHWVSRSACGLGGETRHNNLDRSWTVEARTRTPALLYARVNEASVSLLGASSAVADKLDAGRTPIYWRNRTGWGIAQAVDVFTDPHNVQGWCHHKFSFLRHEPGGSWGIAAGGAGTELQTLHRCGDDGVVGAGLVCKRVASGCPAAPSWERAWYI